MSWQLIKQLFISFFLSLAVGCFPSLFTRAQQPGYRAFRVEENNKDVKINTVFKNRQGYIYAGTSNGLYKFDGNEFSRIHFQNRDYNDTVTAIFQDHLQRTWVGFQGGRIAHISHNKLVYYNPEEGTPQKKITAFAQDSRQHTWFAAYGEGIYYSSNNRIYLISTEDGLTDLNVSKLCATADGAMLAATDQGLNICAVRGSSKNITAITPREGLPDYIVTAITPSSKSQFWIGLQNNGFCLYDHGSKKILPVLEPGAWQHGQVNDILVAQELVWIASSDSGLLKFDRNNRQLTVVNNTRNISQLLSDNQGNVWFTAPGIGLSRTPGDALQLLPLYPPAFAKEIHSILSDHQQHIWINDDINHALLKYVFQNGRYRTERVILNDLAAHTDISALYQDRYNNIWIGTMGKGIFILDPLSGRQRQVKENTMAKNILSISGQQDEVFISSLETAGRVALSPANEDIGKPYHFTSYDNVSTGSNYIYDIFKDSKGRTWFATDGKGIFMQEADRFTYFTEDPRVKDEHVYSITEDKKGNIWFSTAAAGIYKYDGKQFVNYGLKEGLDNLNISAIRSDPSGYLFIVHKKGLDILDPLTGNIYYINQNTGIENINTHDLGAITQDREGRILVSTLDGILRYQRPPNTNQQPTTILESVQVFLQEINPDSMHSFAHDENNFTFNYTGLYYTDPSRVYYQYKLEGLDSSWVITQDKSKNFPRLEPGNYVFRIQSSLNTNFTNAHEAVFHFTIRQAFYKTAWFIIAAILLLAGLVYWYFRHREQELKNLQRLKEEKIAFRFEVLRTQVNPHFLFNSFNTLISAIEEDPKMAVQYVEQLSDFFRNIVNHRDKDVIGLGEELELLQTYFFLQQKRHGNNIQLEVIISEEQKNNCFIPPLTLQLLVENAIKHNVVSKEKPLLVSIRISAEQELQVINNKNVRSSVQPGAGMGLQNIINRFQILTSREVKVKDEENYFIVSLPLIKKQHA